MARMTCKCGKELSNHVAPNDIELIVYTDQEWEQICDCESIRPWMIPSPKYGVWRCPICKRIYVYKDGNEFPIMVYKLEQID
ncbi:MAG: hypothetical protein HFF17_14830 [Oscillospiraceae bacterium]|nr:hypothetical protein [Oscillospiraceae bacterium]